MKKAKQNNHSKWRSPFITFGILVLSQFVFYFFEDTWVLNPGYSPGSIAGRIVESRLFTEWMTLYNTPLLNMSTAVLIVAFIFTAIYALFTD